MTTTGSRPETDRNKTDRNDDPTTEPGGSSAPAPMVWDLPLRLFHWSLAIAVGISIYTGLDGGFYEMDWHVTSGYVVLGLLIFRLLWGIFGPRHARIGALVNGPRALWHWLRGALRRRPPQPIGHNPLAGWFTLVTLCALLLQAVTGLFATDDIFISGPLRHLAPDEFLRWATRMHRRGEWIVIGLVGLHLAALLVHRFLFREKLVGAMITGRRKGAPVDAGIESQRLPLAVVLAAVAAGSTWYIVNL